MVACCSRILPSLFCLKFFVGSVLAGDWAALWAAFRYHCDRPGWAQHCSASFVAKRWADLFPGAFAVVQRLSWTVSIDGARIDRCGVRCQFVIGLDNPRINFEWLVGAHRSSVLATTKRVRESLHRHTQATAVGLDLPGVPHISRCPFSGHQVIFSGSYAETASKCSGFWVFSLVGAWRATCA